VIVYFSSFTLYYYATMTKGRITMSRNSKALVTILALALSSPAPASAWWSLGIHIRERLVIDGELYVNANSYFRVSVDELTKSLELGKKIAVINSGGVIDKIVTLTEETDLSTAYAAAQLPDSGGVKYTDEDGVIRLDAINQGDIVTVETTDGTKTINNDLDVTKETVVANPNPEPTGTPVADPNSSTITALTVSSNNSTSITITPPAATENTHVSVTVVTDGRSHTSVGTDNAGTPVTITDVPANSNVTVQTTITDNITGQSTTVQNPVITTPAAPEPTTPPTPARDEAVDKATITQPAVTSQGEGSNGHRSANIQVPAIPNFDPSKTNVQLVIRDKTGATTAMGLGGEGGIITVDWLSPTESYDIKVVIRDLGTGSETSIAGTRLP
jgi:hypothetical protein